MPGENDHNEQANQQPTESHGDCEIAHDQWIAFLDSFTQQHMDWPVTVEIMSPLGRLVAIHQRPLKSVTLDRANGNERAYVQVCGSPEGHVSHTVYKPTRVTFKRSQSGMHQGLEILSADGTTTAIRFRSAMWPEKLDGIAA